MTTGSAQRWATVRSVSRDLSSLEAANQGPVLSDIPNSKSGVPYGMSELNAGVIIVLE